MNSDVKHYEDFFNFFSKLLLYQGFSSQKRSTPEGKTSNIIPGSGNPAQMPLHSRRLQPLSRSAAVVLS